MRDGRLSRWRWHGQRRKRGLVCGECWKIRCWPERFNGAQSGRDKICDDCRQKQKALPRRGYHRYRSATDPQWSLRRTLRKRGMHPDLLGCSLEEFRAKIETMFEPGMHWANRGEWHLDHIRPLASFDLTDETQRAAAGHHTNFQPLWARDNLSKGARWRG